MLGALALPIARYTNVSLEYACLCLASLALLLTCGRLTRELNHLLEQARLDADHDGLTGALSRSAFRARAGSRRRGVAVRAHADRDAARRPRALRPGEQVQRPRRGRRDAPSGRDADDRGDRRRRLVGRLGGDEFGAIVPDAQAERFAERILAALQRGDDELADGIVASMGVACAPRDGNDADTLLRAADVALRVAKRSGRQQFSFYAGRSLNDEGPEGARRSLDRLIEGHGLMIVVQPIVDLHTRHAHAYEALARFGVSGGDSPLQWFSLADELGMRQELELACMKAALDLFSQRPDGSLLSINLSGPLLLDERTREILDSPADRWRAS